jgi:hypothetical protein
MTKVSVNQTLYAVMDPFWGNPKIIPETVRTSIEDARDAILWMQEHSIYHGGSYADARKGQWKPLENQGYKIVQFSLDTLYTE